MKGKILIFLNVVVLIIAIIWTVNSKYDFEPIIVTITAIITLTGLFFSSLKNKEEKKEDTRGSQNNITVSQNTNSEIEINIGKDEK